MLLAMASRASSAIEVLKRAIASTRPRSLLLRLISLPPTDRLIVSGPTSGCSSRFASAIISGAAQ